jgi:hypothetical protein
MTRDRWSAGNPATCSSHIFTIVFFLEFYGTGLRITEYRYTPFLPPLIWLYGVDRCGMKVVKKMSRWPREKTKWKILQYKFHEARIV